MSFKDISYKSFQSPNLFFQNYRDYISKNNSDSRWHVLTVLRENVIEAIYHVFQTCITFVTSGCKPNENAKKNWSQTIQYAQLTWICLKVLFDYKATLDEITYHAALKCLDELLTSAEQEAVLSVFHDYFKSMPEPIKKQFYHEVSHKSPEDLQRLASLAVEKFNERAENEIEDACMEEAVNQLFSLLIYSFAKKVTAASEEEKTSQLAVFGNLLQSLPLAEFGNLLQSSPSNYLKDFYLKNNCFDEIQLRNFTLATWAKRIATASTNDKMALIRDYQKVLNQLSEDSRKIFCIYLINYFGDINLMNSILSSCMKKSIEIEDLQNNYCNYWIKKIENGYEFDDIADFRALFDDFALWAPNPQLLVTCHLYIIAHLHQCKELTQDTIYGDPYHIKLSITMFLEKFKPIPIKSRKCEHVYLQLDEDTALRLDAFRDLSLSLAKAYEEEYATKVEFDEAQTTHLFNICSYIIHLEDEDFIKSLVLEVSNVDFAYSGPHTERIISALINLKKVWLSAPLGIRKKIESTLLRGTSLKELGLES